MNVRKNLLDLKYQKYLQYFLAVIIILFTYLVGILIGFMTKQIKLSNATDILILSSVSASAIFSAFMFLSKFNSKLKDILSEIEDLNQ